MGIFDIFRSRSSQERFAEEVMRRLRERGWTSPWRYDASRFSLVKEEDGGVFYLGNIYADLQTYPRSQRAAQLDGALGFMFERPDELGFPAVADKLLPVVRNLAHLQLTSLSDPSTPSLGLWQPFRPIAGVLGACVAVDQPSSVALASARMLEAWGCDFDAAFDRAMDNLVQISPVRFDRVEAGFHISDYGDAYDSSRLLMPELFPAIQVRGDPVAIAISRDCLLVAGALETDALVAMARHTVQAFNNATRPTSCLPLVLRDGSWSVFMPTEPALAPLRELVVRQAHVDYGGQSPALEAYFAGVGRDVFVAPFEVVREGWEHGTWSSWTEGVPTLLPAVDAIGMTRGDGTTLIRRWVDVEALCGAFVPEEGLYPARFNPPAWPDAVTWRRLEMEFAAPAWWPPGEEA